jgi:hypothetical protein
MLRSNRYDDAFGVNGGAGETAKSINVLLETSAMTGVTTQLQSFNFWFT